MHAFSIFDPSELDMPNILHVLNKLAKLLCISQLLIIQLYKKLLN